jgi:hypothetical protein
VPTPIEVGQLAFAHGRAKKRNNAIVAIFSGALPGMVLTHYMHPGRNQSCMKTETRVGIRERTNPQPRSHKPESLHGIDS